MPTPQTQVPHVFGYGSKYGLIDTEGKILLEPQFERLSQFHAGYASFQQDDLWGFIDTEGNIVVKPMFEANWNPIFNEGLAMAGYSGERFYFNLDGERILPGPYIVGTCFKEGMAAVKHENRDTCSIIDPEGKTLSELPINLLWNMCFVEPDWDWNQFVGAVGNEIHAEADYPGLCGIFNWKGECLFQPKYPIMTPFQGATACFSECKEPYNRRFGLVDREGTERRPNELYGDGFFSEGLVTAGEKRNLLGYLNTDGVWSIEPKFQVARAFSESLAYVGVGGLGFGYIDTTGEFVIPPGPISEGSSFRNGLAHVKHRGKHALINPLGEVIWKAKA